MGGSTAAGRRMRYASGEVVSCFSGSEGSGGLAQRSRRFHNVCPCGDRHHHCSASCLFCRFRCRRRRLHRHFCPYAMHATPCRAMPPHAAPCHPMPRRARRTPRHGIQTSKRVFCQLMGSILSEYNSEDDAAAECSRPKVRGPCPHATSKIQNETFDILTFDK